MSITPGRRRHPARQVHRDASRGIVVVLEILDSFDHILRGTREKEGLSNTERANVLLGELYRHRQAVHDEEDRLATRVHELRQMRSRLDAEIEELVFSPSWTEEWFVTQARAIRDAEIPEIWRLRSEAQFLLTAARGAYLTAKALIDLVPASGRQCVRAAVSEFQAAVPDHDVLRHVHEHFSDYLAGHGHLQRKLPDPIIEETSGIGLLDTGVAYLIGGKLFVLPEVATAAEAMAAKIAECSRSGWARRQS